MAIPGLTAAELAALRAQVGSRHADLVRELTWLDELDAQPAVAGAPPERLTVIAFNAERGSRFDGICELLSRHPALRGADILLLSEVDWGMARSGNRHVTRDLAAALGLGYVFAIEFLELTKGEAAELDAPGENTRSLHGNAILSRWPLTHARVVRLPRHCSWAVGSEVRIGGRIALLAEVTTAAGAVTLASTHLENRTTPHGRRDQMAAILSAVAGHARVIIGGDLNTSTLDAGQNEQILAVPEYLEADPLRLRNPEPYEPLFADLRNAGFVIDEINPRLVPTNVPLGIQDRTYWLKLDWLFARGLSPASIPAPQVVPAEHAAVRVSDHDFIVASFACGG